MSITTVLLTSFQLAKYIYFKFCGRIENDDTSTSDLSNRDPHNFATVSNISYNPSPVVSILGAAGVWPS